MVRTDTEPPRVRCGNQLRSSALRAFSSSWRIPRYPMKSLKTFYSPWNRRSSSLWRTVTALQCNKIILCGARARRARVGDQRNINSADPARTRVLNNQRIGSLEQFTDSRVSLKMYPVMKCHVFWGICFRCDQRNSRFRNDYVCWRAKQSLKIVNHRLLHSDLNTAKKHIQMYMPTDLCIWLENVNLLTTNWSSLFLMLILKSCNMFFKGKYS